MTPEQAQSEKNSDVHRDTVSVAFEKEWKRYFAKEEVCVGDKALVKPWFIKGWNEATKNG